MYERHYFRLLDSAVFFCSVTPTGSLCFCHLICIFCTSFEPFGLSVCATFHASTIDGEVFEGKRKWNIQCTLAEQKFTSKCLKIYWQMIQIKYPNNLDDPHVDYVFFFFFFLDASVTQTVHFCTYGIDFNRF